MPPRRSIASRRQAGTFLRRSDAGQDEVVPERRLGCGNATAIRIDGVCQELLRYACRVTPYPANQPDFSDGRDHRELWQRRARCLSSRELPTLHDNDFHRDRELPFVDIHRSSGVFCARAVQHCKAFHQLSAGVFSNAHPKELIHLTGECRIVRSVERLRFAGWPKDMAVQSALSSAHPRT